MRTVSRTTAILNLSIDEPCGWQAGSLQPPDLPALDSDSLSRSQAVVVVFVFFIPRTLPPWPQPQPQQAKRWTRIFL